MNITILGAGAIGGWIGAKLALAGHNVSVLARGETLRAIAANGLRLQTQTHEHVAKVFATDDAREIAKRGAQEVIVVAVKAPALASIASAMPVLTSEHTTIMTAMNGVPHWFFARKDRPLYGKRIACLDPDGSIETLIPSDRVIGAVVHASCSVTAPGVVQHRFGEKLIVGEASGGDSLRLSTIIAMLNAAQFEAVESHDIQRDVWFKLWGNMTMNPISAITGATGDRMLDDDLVREFASAVMLEAKAVGEAIGIAIPDAPEDRHAITRKLGAFKTSMLQDVEAGRAIELDALVNAVREIGQKVGVATPSMDALFGLTRVMANTRGLY